MIAMAFHRIFTLMGIGKFPNTRNGIGFSLTLNLRGSGEYVFSYTFSVEWKSTFPMFLELYGFLLYPKYLRNT